MWNNLAKWVLRFRLPLLILIAVITAFMGLFASRLELSYDFSKTIPLDHPKYIEYQAFQKHFGDDGGMLVAGLHSDDFYSLPVFTAYTHLQKALKHIHGVEFILSVPSAITLVKDTVTSQLKVASVFPADIHDQATGSPKRHKEFVDTAHTLVGSALVHIQYGDAEGLHSCKHRKFG